MFNGVTLFLNTKNESPIVHVSCGSGESERVVGENKSSCALATILTLKEPATDTVTGDVILFKLKLATFKKKA
jgi:hypothetical protein